MPAAQASPLFGQELLKRRLLDNDVAHSAQALSPRLLLVQQLLPSSDIAGMELGQNVLAERLDRLTGDDALPGCRLDDDLCKAH